MSAWSLKNKKNLGIVIFINRKCLKASSSIKLKNNQTFSKKEYVFICSFWIYIYWSWLFFSYYTYQPNSQIWVDLRNKRQQDIHCFLSEKSKFHGINQLRRQWLYPKNYKHLNLAQLLDLCCSVLQLVRLDCGSILVV